MTPLPDTPTRHDAVMEDDDGDDIILVSENLRTPRSKAGPSSPPESAPPATPSPGAKRRRTSAPFQKSSPNKRAKHKEGEDVKHGKKGEHSVDEDDEDHKEERLVSAELQAEKSDEEDKHDNGGGSPSKKFKERKAWTEEEDKIIAQQHVLINKFEWATVQKLTGRPKSSIIVRIRILLRTALRGLHGEGAIMPVSKTEAARQDEDSD
ncbi:hypothetical protein PHBOTO_001898 [Pseudozyma hubeiensis]|nr:hypothetical protein PHBOTO_001898 [Pseudozyma hubeiensis]